jgi:hypothetical protein
VHAAVQRVSPTPTGHDTHDDAELVWTSYPPLVLTWSGKIYTTLSLDQKLMMTQSLYGRVTAPGSHSFRWGLHYTQFRPMRHQVYMVKIEKQKQLTHDDAELILDELPAPSSYLLR